jgi:hypothetical protein
MADNQSISVIETKSPASDIKTIDYKNEIAPNVVFDINENSQDKTNISITYKF